MQIAVDIFMLMYLIPHCQNSDDGTLAQIVIAMFVKCNRRLIGHEGTTQNMPFEILRLLTNLCKSTGYHFTKALRALFSVQSIPVLEPIYLIKALVKRHPGTCETLPKICNIFIFCVCVRDIF